MLLSKQLKNGQQQNKLNYLVCLFVFFTGVYIVTKCDAE